MITADILLSLLAALGKDEVQLNEVRASALQLCLSLLSTDLIDAEVTGTTPSEAIERERERIARDIHDGAAQRIASVLPRLAYITRLLEREKGGLTGVVGETGETGRQVVQRELGRACKVLEEGLDELQHSISALLPPQLEQQNFDAALRALLDDLAFNEPGVEVVYDGDVPAPVPPALEVHIFRFVQEALNNARKHARATRVSVSIRLLTGLLVVEVHDNGVGFDPRQAVRTGVGAGISAGVTTGAGDGKAMGVRDKAETGKKSLHFGLREMRERIMQAGGRWEVRSTPGMGTLVKAVFPVSKSAIVLTSREREVLRLLVEGLTNRAIAEKLSVSIETVKSHVHHIMQKMGVRDRTQAAVVATKLRLL